jgi:hypothetical protein
MIFNLENEMARMTGRAANSTQAVANSGIEGWRECERMIGKAFQYS